MMQDHTAFDLPEPTMRPEPTLAEPPLILSTSKDGCGAGSAAGGEGPPPAAPDVSATYIPVASMEAILTARWQQIHKWGHTPEKDAYLPMAHFARELRSAVGAVVEDVSFHRPENMRRHLIKLGALTLAAMDRLDLDEPSQ